MLCHKPAYDFSFFKILAAFFATTFPYLVIDQVFTALLFLTLLFLSHHKYKYILHCPAFAFHQSERLLLVVFLSRFFHLTEEKSIYIIFHIDFWTITHISYLTHIFWNLSLHFILTFLSLLFNFPGIALNIAQGNREILSISVR